MYQDIIKWLENNQLPCFYRKYLGIRCPGCGMQTAFIELLKGNIWESLVTYPALIPMLIMFLYLIAHLIFKFKKGPKVLIIMFMFVVVLILFNYIYRLIIE